MQKDQQTVGMGRRIGRAAVQDRPPGRADAAGEVAGVAATTERLTTNCTTARTGTVSSATDPQSAPVDLEHACTAEPEAPRGARRRSAPSTIGAWSAIDASRRRHGSRGMPSNGRCHVLDLPPARVCASGPNAPPSPVTVHRCPPSCDILRRYKGNRTFADLALDLCLNLTSLTDRRFSREPSTVAVRGPG